MTSVAAFSNLRKDSRLRACCGSRVFFAMKAVISLHRKWQLTIRKCKFTFTYNINRREAEAGWPPRRKKGEISMAVASIPVVEALAAKPEHPLRNPNFRLLLTGGTISLLGDQCYLVALPWLVLQMTGSAVAMGTMLMAAAIPRAVLMLMGGALSDRISPRKIMMITATARTVYVGVIGLLVWLHVLRLWELYTLSFLFGVADAFSFPAGQTYLPSLVKREQLVAANSVLQSTAQLTTIAGPAPAGIAIKALGIAWAFFLDAISFLFIIAALWFLPDPPVQSAAKTKRSMLPSILEGLAYVRRDVPLRSMMLLAAIMNLCISGPMGVGLPYLTKNRFGSASA